MSASDVRDTVTVEIHFPYFKQGDDFGDCGGDLERFITFHQYVINYARAILDKIPENMRQHVTGYGDTHHCTLTGPTHIMDAIVKAQLANYIEFDD